MASPGSVSAASLLKDGISSTPYGDVKGSRSFVTKGRSPQALPLHYNLKTTQESSATVHRRSSGGQSSLGAAGLAATTSHLSPTNSSSGGSVQVVDAPTSLKVETEEGLMVVPAHTWLFLDCGSMAPLPQDGSGTSGNAPQLVPAATVELQLLATLGGGSVMEGASMLREVKLDRLHAGAAEANFQRASRGTSLLALRHAAHALQLLADTDRKLPGLPPSAVRGASPQTARCPARRLTALAALAEADPLSSRAAPSPKEKVRALSSPKSARVSDEAFARNLARGSSTPMTSRLSDEVFSRFQRMESLVAGQAEAAQRRASSPRTMVRVGSLERVQEEKTSRRSSLQKGFQAKEIFFDFAQRRFGNMVRLWAQLDKEENMKLGEMQFLRSCEEIGFRGNVHALYRYIDCDRSGILTFEEVDPRSTLQLMAFKSFMEKRFGGATRAFAILDQNKSRRVYKAELVEALAHHKFEGHGPSLFELLDRRGSGFVVQSDLAYLDRWEAKPYFFVSPDNEGLEKLRSSIVEFMGPALFRAWHKFFDRDGSMRVGWDKFCMGCRRLKRTSITMPPGFLETEQSMAGVWRALDPDCLGWIALRHFDAKGHAVIAEFKLWSDRHYGSVMGAFQVIDNNGSGRCSLREMRKACKEKGFSGNLEELFNFFDKDGSGALSATELRFLDSWDLEWEEWEMNQPHSIRGGRRSPRKK